MIKQVKQSFSNVIYYHHLGLQIRLILKKIKKTKNTFDY